MKTANARQAETPTRRQTARRDSVGSAAAIPAEARRSTAAALLHAPGWSGDDLADVIATVTGTRTKTRF
ncbi:MAG TPA: hypothetical protein VE974_02535 [Thermoanaerobaculia bacterium]|nr:hypothetical protein [Thermoanaerobaculia bacterium]